MRTHHHDHSASGLLDSLSLASTINPTFGYFTAAAPFARPRNTVQQRCFTARLLSSAFADIVAFVLFCFGLFLMSACLCGVSALKLADCKMLVSNSNFFLSLFIFSALNSWLLLVLECFVAAASKKKSHWLFAGGITRWQHMVAAAWQWTSGFHTSGGLMMRSAQTSKPSPSLNPWKFMVLPHPMRLSGENSLSTLYHL